MLQRRAAEDAEKRRETANHLASPVGEFKSLHLRAPVRPLRLCVKATRPCLNYMVPAERNDLVVVATCSNAETQRTQRDAEIELPSRLTMRCRHGFSLSASLCVLCDSAFEGISRVAIGIGPVQHSKVNVVVLNGGVELDRHARIRYPKHSFPHGANSHGRRIRSERLRKGVARSQLRAVAICSTLVRGRPHRQESRPAPRPS